MKYNLRFILTFLLFSFLLPISTQASERDSLECRSPTMNFIAELLPTPDYSISQEITLIRRNSNLSEDNAKGVLGENAARGIVRNRLIEEHPFNSFPYISIFTLFRGWGCDIIPFFRNSSDNGLDDVFIVSILGSTWNDAYPPIFHEAKFKGDGKLKLNKNRRSCDQLSIIWTGDHLDTAQNKIFKTAQLCFHPTEIRVAIKMPACNPCNEKIHSCINWLNNQFKNGKFYRTASVLDNTGRIKFYLAEQDQYKKYTYTSFDASNTKQLLSTDIYYEDAYTQSEETLGIQNLTISQLSDYSDYSRENLYNFLNYLPREETYKAIANACTKYGFPIGPQTISNLINNKNHALSKDYSQLWEALKKAYSIDFKEWVNS